MQRELQKKYGTSQKNIRIAFLKIYVAFILQDLKGKIKIHD